MKRRLNLIPLGTLTLALFLCDCRIELQVPTEALETNTGNAPSNPGSPAQPTEPTDSPTNPAPPTGTTTPPGSPTSCASALFCDDFEGPAAGQSPSSDKWTSVSGAVIDTSTSKAGSKSLKIQMANPAGDHGAIGKVRTDKFFSKLTKNHFFGRMFVKMATLPALSDQCPNTTGFLLQCPGDLKPGTTANWAHWTFVWTGDSSTAPVVRLGGQLFSNTSIKPAYAFWAVDTDHGAVGDKLVADEDKAEYHVKTNQWYCVEWEFDGESNHSQVWIDGVARPALDTYNLTNTPGEMKYPKMNYVDIGWGLWQATKQAFTTWIDEVAFDSKRIGCDP